MKIDIRLICYNSYLNNQEMLESLYVVISMLLIFVLAVTVVSAKVRNEMISNNVETLRAVGSTFDMGTKENNIG